MVLGKEKYTSICAVIVTYHPDLTRLEKLLRRLESQTAAMIIVDNSTSLDVQEYVEECWHDIQIIRLEKNHGVAVAQNKGIDAAIEKGFEFVLLMDQDSIPYEHMVAQLHLAYSELVKKGKNISGVGPTYVNPIHERKSHFYTASFLGFKRIYCPQTVIEEYVPLDCLISSGSLINTDVIRRIGYMEEGLFIDHVDTEWFLRANSHGYEAFGVCAAKMTHNLGDGVRKYWLFGWRATVFHQPFRYYYMYRNSILLYKKSYIPIKWKVADCILRIKTFIFLSLFGYDRIKSIRYIKAGVLDGIKGKSGSI